MSADRCRRSDCGHPAAEHDQYGCNRYAGAAGFCRCTGLRGCPMCNEKATGPKCRRHLDETREEVGG